MKPYYQDKWVQIFFGDCRQVLPELGVIADIVFTSPPYNVGIDYGGAYLDKKALPEYKRWLRSCLRKTFAATADPSRLYLLIGDNSLWWVRTMIESLGWRYHQKLTWCKSNLCGTTLKISGDWNFLTEDILLFHRGKRKPMLGEVMGVRTFNWIVASSPQSQYKDNHRVHPAQFPIQLVKMILARTPGDVVLDPFLGSGSTAVAAKSLNRKCIGIEISERYCEIAARRCCQEVMELA
ncbi:Modification methylase DpnIIB [subsurface metagenome]